MTTDKRTPEGRARWYAAVTGPRKSGRPSGRRRNTPEDVWKFINKRGDDECWEWFGAKQTGYGVFAICSRYYKAHRIVYSIAVAPIQLEGPLSSYHGNHVLHHCDNRACCNPKHLYLGDIWDNMQDKVARDRTYKGGPRKRAIHGV